MLNMFNMSMHLCIPISWLLPPLVTGQSHSSQAASTPRSPHNTHYPPTCLWLALPLRHSILPQELEATETWPLLLAVTKAVRRGPFRRGSPSASSLLDSFSAPPPFVVCTFSVYAIYPLFARTNKPRNDMCPSVHSELKVSTGIS